MSVPMIQTVFRAARPSRAHEAVTVIRHCKTSTLQASSYAKSSARTNRTATRAFSTTRPQRATVVAQNPREDEDGNQMTITISERAAKRLRKITSTPAQRNTLTSSSSMPADSHLRVTVTSGGCHGFQYLMALEPSDKIDAEEDTIFVAEAEGEGSAKVVLDESSLELLKGSTVDFTTELIGSQFKIVGNPRATSSCGCGTSFDIE